MISITMKVGDFVLHRESGILGEVRRIYEAGEYEDGDGNSIPEPCARLDDGNVLLLRDDDKGSPFVVLSMELVALYSLFHEDIQNAVANIIFAASEEPAIKALGKEAFPTINEILFGVLKTSLRDLSTQNGRARAIQRAQQLRARLAQGTSEQAQQPEEQGKTS